jgi:hypothetical protein
MIHEIVVTNPRGEKLPLTLMRPETSGLIVMDILGLGPANSSINIKENSFGSGSIFNSMKTPSRNIVLTLRFLPAPTIEATRLRTYKFFQSESKIKLDIKTDAGTFYIEGYVESNEPTIFSKEEGTTISLLCPDPFFRSEAGSRSGKIEQIAKMFAFPFSNETDDETIIFGETFFQSVDFIIPCESTISIAPTLTLHAVGGVVSDPRILFYHEYESGDAESLGFAFTTELPALEDGDYLEIVCERGNKSVRRYKALTNEFINYIGTVTLDSSWPILRPGNNVFSYDAVSGGAFIRFSYTYKLQYTGV